MLIIVSPAEFTDGSINASRLELRDRSEESHQNCGIWSEKTAAGVGVLPYRRKPGQWQLNTMPIRTLPLVPPHAIAQTWNPSH